MAIVKTLLRYKGEFHDGCNLPHNDSYNILHAITFRLCVSIPASAIAKLERQLLRVADDDKKREIMRKKIQYWLDQGHGCCALRDKSVAEIVVNSLKFFNEQRYDLVSWVIMPNHVHVIIRCYDDFPLFKIIKSWKSFSAREIHRGKNVTGAFWQSDYFDFDRFIREAHHLLDALNYIKKNVKHGGVCWHLPSEIMNLDVCVQLFNKTLDKGEG